ncbi:hypothetical protein BGZ65_007593, partial [Modicella reniformis]
MHDDTDAGRLIPMNLPALAIDYLGSTWTNEEDIAASWKFMTKQKHDLINGLRLENASWRNWAKQRHNLKTISPKVLNWLKDSDTTWLYGPLYQAAIDDFDVSRFGTQTLSSESAASSSTAVALMTMTTANGSGKALKPALKHRTISERFKSDTLFHAETDMMRLRRQNGMADESAVFKEHRHPKLTKLRFNDSVAQCVSIDMSDIISSEDGRSYYDDDEVEEEEEGGILELGDDNVYRIRRRSAEDENENGDGSLVRISPKRRRYPKSIIHITPTRLKSANWFGVSPEEYYE